jgi:acetyl esterase/lipase
MSKTGHIISILLFYIHFPLHAADFSEQTITYFSDSTITLKATLYVPDTGQDLPALILIHEGGFTSGSRYCFAQYGEYFTRRGFAVMSIDYRLVQQGGQWPKPLEDCLEAVAWLRKYGAQYRIDKNQIVLIGASAGAYLATMIGLAPGLPAEIVRNRDVVVRGVVSSFGVYDWTESNWRDEAFLPAALEDAASPIRYAQHAQCSFLILAGERDRLFDPSQARAFADALTKYGQAEVNHQDATSAKGVVEMYVKPQQNHAGLCDLHGPLAQWALPLIENFIKKVLPE